jgi:hypothetical protein
MLGRLQTDADRERVMEGLGEDEKKSALSAMVKKLAHRWFVVKDARNEEPALVHSRGAISLLRGPMTRSEIRRRREESSGDPRPASALGLRRLG